ncbi:polysaccharide biosynthesis protein [Hutsoniella sourekii]
MKVHSLTQYFVDMVNEISGTTKARIWRLADLVSFIVSGLLAYSFFWELTTVPLIFYALAIGLGYLAYLLLSKFTGLSQRLNRYSGIADLTSLFFLVCGSSLLGGFLVYGLVHPISIRYLLLATLLTGVSVIGLRTLWQALFLSRQRMVDLQGGNTDEKRRLLVIGAGDGGSLFMDNYKRHPQNIEVVGILDQDPDKHNKVIGGARVLGDIDLIPDLVNHYAINEIVVAIPSIQPEAYEKILAITNPYKVQLYKMPKVEEVIQGSYRPLVTANQVNIADLLGRKEIQLDEQKLRAEIEGKTILITGAGGSIGSEIVRQVTRLNPRTVVLLGHGENSIYQIYHEMLKVPNMVNYEPVIADIKDYDRLLAVFEKYQPDIVYHAAAHKHVPLMEMNPVETFTNNIKGTYNVAKAVDATATGKMVMVSTDKAVNSTNVMGASKRVAELIVTAFDQKSESTYCSVRFGNVLGSRGSVIPVFEKQIKAGGPVTVTDFRMIRYFMTIPEASQLVIYAGAFAQNGEVFILDMGEPVRIVDLARKLILLSGYTEDEIEIVESGIRPGEKLYEELLASEENVARKIDDKIFIGKVETMSLDDLDRFIGQIEGLPVDQLKQEIISFANATTQDKPEASPELISE